MTYTEANDLLDKRRAGADMPDSVIFKALELTGDLDLDVMAALVMLEFQKTDLEIN